MAKKAVKRVATPKRGAAKNVKTEKPETEAKVDKTEPEKAEEKSEEKVEKSIKEEVKEEPNDDKMEVDKTQVDEKVEEKLDIKSEQETEQNDESESQQAEEEEEEEEENPDGETDELNDSTQGNKTDEANEKEGEKKQERAESPLNILIGEEEENLLLQSGDEKPDDTKTEENKETENKEAKEDDKDKKTDDKVEKTAETTEDKKSDDKNKNSKSNQQGRSLWVTNLLPSTRAQELKHLLSRYGKVIGAKVVQSSRHPRTRCYGYVTMETRAAADHCIKKLNNTELKGQIIRVAKVRPEHSLPLKSDTAENGEKQKTPAKTDDKPKEEKKSQSTEKKITTEKKKDDKPVKKDSKERDSHRSSSKKASPRRDKKTDVLTFDKIREERDRHRARERERAAREEEKRRREIQRSREIERRQREEAQRLEREREKLRMERERLDRQRQEILRLERERQKLEREKLEQEKQELRRQQIRLEEARRPVKRPASTSTSTYRRETYPDDRKREAREERHYEEAPPPPRFEVPARETPREAPKKEIEKDYKPHIYSKHSEDYKRDYKRDFPASERHYPGGGGGISGANGSKYESSSQYVNRDREIREPTRREVPKVGPPNISNDVRYNERPSERSPVAYRNVREERDRRPIADHHAKGEIRSSRESRDHRYEPVANIKESGRYRDGNWHSSGPSPTQPFSSIPNSSSREWSKGDNWRPIETGSNDRWVGNSSSRIILGSSSGVPGSLYPSGNASGLSCPPPPGSSGYSMDRFENYKSISNPRKY